MLLKQRASNLHCKKMTTWQQQQPTLFNDNSGVTVGLVDDREDNASMATWIVRHQEEADDKVLVDNDLEDCNDHDEDDDDNYHFKNVTQYFKGVDYRGFIFVYHKEYGMMILLSTNKEDKGSHFQTPGGHMEAYELEEAGCKYSLPEQAGEILMKAGKTGAARELWEETRIDVRGHLDRLEPAIVRDDAAIAALIEKRNQKVEQLKKKKEMEKKHKSKKKKKKKGDTLLAENEGEDLVLDVNSSQPELVWDLPRLKNHYKHRLFFFLLIDDDDFPSQGNVSSMGVGKELKIVLSDEHNGFMFQSNPTEVVYMLTNHSGGKVSTALEMTLNITLDDKIGGNVQRMVRERAYPIGQAPWQQQQQPLATTTTATKECPSMLEYMLGVLLVFVLPGMIVLVLWRRMKDSLEHNKYQKVASNAGDYEHTNGDGNDDGVMTFELSKR